MKINLICIYWILLLVSFVSSCLLFILVASETVPTSSVASSQNDDTINKNEAKVVLANEENISVNKLTQEPDIRSSFEEIAQEVKPSDINQVTVTLLEYSSQNVGIAEGMLETGQTGVLSAVEQASIDLQQRAEALTTEIDPPERNNSVSKPTIAVVLQEPENETNLIEEDTQYVVRAEPKQPGVEAKILTENKTEEISVEVNATVQELVTEAPPQVQQKIEEEMPSFSEWTQKQLEQAERTGGEQINVQQGRILRSKNYASPDCGAKIVATNPEAQGASNVLSSGRDEYMLNACTTRIWLVVELCEPVQAHKVDLANFELFSSSPQEFAVSVSDRYPTREWSQVGQFTALDHKNVQSFQLKQQLFAKFIKLEVLSHYGSEHFCPISLFRVYGTSELEVLETEHEVREPPSGEPSDEEDLLDAPDPTTNLFGSARDAVMSIVKKAAVLLKSNENTNSLPLDTALNPIGITPPKCVTPAHLIVCDNCTDILYTQVFNLVSCRMPLLRYVAQIPNVKQLLTSGDICSTFGLHINGVSVVGSNRKVSYLTEKYLPSAWCAALCNILAADRHKVLLNTTLTHKDYLNVSGSCPRDIPDTCAPRINPTKTLELGEENLQKKQEGYMSNEVSAGSQVVQPSESPALPAASISTTIPTQINQTHHEPDFTSIPLEDSTETFEIPSENFDLLTDLDTENTITTTPITPTNNAPQQQKESVFLRLSNRIKALERNMSLSGQYLEELSRRYKKQVDEMQRIFDKKLSELYEEKQKSQERSIHIQKQLDNLTRSVQILTTEKENSIWKTVTLLTQFLIVEICVASVLLYFCWKPDIKHDYKPPEPTRTRKSKSVIVKRRKSIDVIHESPTLQKRRRPSEETLRLSGNYDDLLILEPEGPTRAEKRRRRKKNATLHSRRVSCVELSSKLANGDVSNISRVQVVPIPQESAHNSVVVSTDEKNSQNGTVQNISKPSKITSPLFMVTALSARSKRASSKSLQLYKTDKESSHDDRSSIGSDTNVVKKEKKSDGLKRFFKKVFD